MPKNSIYKNELKGKYVFHKAYVTIQVDNNAEIWINGEKKGEGSWSGNLGAGTYELEAKKEGHRSTTTTQDFIVTSEPQIVKLKLPPPSLVRQTSTARQEWLIYTLMVRRWDRRRN